MSPSPSPELLQLVELFEDKPINELQSILYRYGGSADLAVKAICSGKHGRKQVAPSNFDVDNEKKMRMRTSAGGGHAVRQFRRPGTEELSDDDTSAPQSSAGAAFAASRARAKNSYASKKNKNDMRFRHDNRRYQEDADEEEYIEEVSQERVSAGAVAVSWGQEIPRTRHDDENITLASEMRQTVSSYPPVMPPPQLGDEGGDVLVAAQLADNFISEEEAVHLREELAYYRQAAPQQGEVAHAQAVVSQDDDHKDESPNDDELERKRSRCLVWIALGILGVVGIIVGVVIAVTSSSNGNDNGDSASPSGSSPAIPTFAPTGTNTFAPTTGIIAMTEAPSVVGECVKYLDPMVLPFRGASLDFVFENLPLALPGTNVIVHTFVRGDLGEPYGASEFYEIVTQDGQVIGINQGSDIECEEDFYQVDAFIPAATFNGFLNDDGLLKITMDATPGVDAAGVCALDQNQAYVGITVPEVNCPQDPAPSLSPAPNGPSPEPSATGITLEDFLFATLTDDGSLTEPGTPQNEAFTTLQQTNPELDPNDPNDQTEITERYSLNTLFFATLGGKWSSNTGWTTSSQLCANPGWFGILCSDEDDVLNLDLRSNNLAGSLPSELRGLSDLKVLILTQNSVSGDIITDIGTMTALEDLELGRNDIVGEIPSEIGLLTDLQVLSLLGNQLEGSIPSALGNLVNLRQFDLFANQLAGDVPDIFGNMTNVEFIDMSSNFLGPELPESLFHLPRLGLLNLTLNGIRAQIPSTIDLPLLRQFLISDNFFDSRLPSEFGKLTSLADFEIGRNFFSGTLPTDFGRMTSLVTLSVTRNGLSGPLPSELGLLTNVVLLSAENNAFNGTIPPDFSGLSRAQAIALSTNTLRGPIPTTLGLLEDLIILQLNTNTLSGTIPSELGQISTLQMAMKQDNDLTGVVPSELCALRNVDLQILVVDCADNEVQCPIDCCTDCNF